jgi:uncharacterized membrane protein
MESHLLEWANLLLRWGHLIAGVGWIGTSFYFIALDLGLRRRDHHGPGILGSAWQVHGGGFYHVEKFTVAPPHLPPDLHWFKWEAYLTWATGLGLMVVQFHAQASTYLIDPAVLALTPWQAIGLSLASMLGAWLVYHGMCESRLGDRPRLLAALIFGLIVAMAGGFAQVFSGRGALLHVGAVIGTCMAANVFRVIIPRQRIMIGQMLRGATVDAALGRAGKVRSVHNNYLTLPVLLLMVSGHYPMLTSHPHPTLVVAAVLLLGGAVRHAFNRADAGAPARSYAWTLPVAAASLLAAVVLTAPAKQPAMAAVPDAEAARIIATHCATCHAQVPRFPGFAAAPKGVRLESLADLRRHAPSVLAQAGVGRAMPPGNPSGMTEAERAQLVAWIAAR